MSLDALGVRSGEPQATLLKEIPELFGFAQGLNATNRVF
jgi:hypothetical protein